MYSTRVSCLQVGRMKYAAAKPRLVLSESPRERVGGRQRWQVVGSSQLCQQVEKGQDINILGSANLLICRWHIKLEC